MTLSSSELSLSISAHEIAIIAEKFELDATILIMTHHFDNKQEEEII